MNVHPEIIAIITATTDLSDKMKSFITILKVSIKILNSEYDGQVCSIKEPLSFKKVQDVQQVVKQIKVTIHTISVLLVSFLSMICLLTITYAACEENHKAINDVFFPDN